MCVHAPSLPIGCYMQRLWSLLDRKVRGRKVERAEAERSGARGGESGERRSRVLRRACAAGPVGGEA